jgi:hypothetical protein
MIPFATWSAVVQILRVLQVRRHEDTATIARMRLCTLRGTSRLRPGATTESGRNERRGASLLSIYQNARNSPHTVQPLCSALIL